MTNPQDYLPPYHYGIWSFSDITDKRSDIPDHDCHHSIKGEDGCDCDSWEEKAEAVCNTTDFMSDPDSYAKYVEE